MLAVLLVAEIGVRVISDDLPPPLVWHTYEAQKKAAQMDRLAERGGADVVFLGTSMMNTGLSPSAFASQLGNGVTAYNAALSSQVGRQAELWARLVVQPKLRPKVLVLGVSSPDFDDLGNAPTTFYDAFLDSSAVERALGRSSAMDKVDRWIGDRSELWHHRFQLRDPPTVWRALRGRAAEEANEVTAIGPDGQSSAVSGRRFEDRILGFGLNMSNWAPGTTDVDAIARLVRRAKSAGTMVVLVDMPVTDEFIARHPNGQADYDTYRSLLRTFATRMSVRLIEVTDLRDHAMFADEIHLNAAGAAAFTAAIASQLATAAGQNWK